MKQIGDVVCRIQYCGAERKRRRVVHHNQFKLCTTPQANVELQMQVPKGRCSKGDSQGIISNRNASQATPNLVAVDDPSGNEIDVSVGDETVNLEADTMAGPEADAMGKLEAEGHVIEGSENHEAENVIEGSENPETVGQLLENADETGTNGSGVQRITRSGRQSRMRQHPDFEYY